MYRIPVKPTPLPFFAARSSQKPTPVPAYETTHTTPPLTSSAPKPKTRYNPPMETLAIFGMHLLEIAFFVGLAGSSIVVIISFIEDGKELFGEDEHEAPLPH